jgi:hypothetical protein
MVTERLDLYGTGVVRSAALAGQSSRLAGRTMSGMNLNFIGMSPRKDREDYV